MKYSLFFEKQAAKQLEKLDIVQQKIIVSWISKNLENNSNPRAIGKPLKGNLKNYWRYRIGKYRVIAEINDKKVSIFIIEVGHRKDIYK